MVTAAKFTVGDLVRDRALGLIWKVVDRDDDGTIYIERENMRSFTSPWNLERYVPELDGRDPSV